MIPDGGIARSGARRPQDCEKTEKRNGDQECRREPRRWLRVALGRATPCARRADHATETMRNHMGRI